MLVSQQNMDPLRRVLHFYRPDASGILSVAVLLLLGIVANVITPWPAALLVDFLAGRPGRTLLPQLDLQSVGAPYLAVWVALATLLIHLLRGGLSAATQYLSIRIGLRALARVRPQIADRLQEWSWPSQQRMTSGDLIYRASWDVYSVQTLFQQGVMVLGTAVLTLTLMVVVMVRISPKLTGVSLAIAPLLMGVIHLLGPRMSQRGEAARQADSRVTTLFQQMVQHLPLIQSFLRGPFVRRAFQKQTDLACASRLAQHGSEVLYSFVVAIVFGLGSAAMLWVGANEVTAGRISLGQLTIFLAYLGLLYEPLNQLSHVGSTVSTARAGVIRVLELLEIPDEGEDTPHPLPFPDLLTVGRGRVRPLIEFRDVAFSYTPGGSVLRGVSLKVFEGDVVAILGPSGVGKSTLLHLLSRFYDPASGSVEVGGQDLRKLARGDLRLKVAVLFQEPVLLTGSVADNIGFGREGATHHEIISAARSANAHDFIVKLPQGYETQVGDGAARLSVGEKQRLSLARVFLKDAPIVLLDEPTSALDEAGEALVIDGLRRLLAGRTVLLVTHRPALLSIATRVVQIKDGMIERTA